MLLSGFLAFLFVREPASIKKTVYEEKGYTSLEMLQTKQFYYLIFVMTGGLTSYFIISPISQSLQIERGVLPSIAIRAVMIGSLANAFSRIIFPWLSDKTSRIRCIQWILILAILAMFSLLFFDHLTTIAIILLYGCYGGIMGSFPAFTTSIFGLLHAGENYGYVMSGMIFASILALIISNITTTVEDAIIIGIILEVIALFFLVSLSKVVYNDKQ
jgi:OFA family oxalate/formate antiporter-like MFS transporter